MKNLFRLVLALVLALAVAACGDDDGTSDTTAGGDTADGVTIVMENTSYDPANVTVEVGTTVTWVHQDGGLAHTTTSATGEWDSGEMTDGDEFSFTFEETGSFAYFCEFHPGVMTGTITVTG